MIPQASSKHQRVSVLVSSRKNSKYLAKFILGLWSHTADPMKVQVLVIMNEHDTWNNELEQFFSDMDLPLDLNVEFYRENLRLGRAGLHEYFNMLLPHARGDWLIYFCDDHFVNYAGWDLALQRVISGYFPQGDSQGKSFPLDPSQPWVLVPKFDNCGAMNHIVSRGFIEALGGKIGNHGWIDSYINDLMREMPERVIRIDKEWFHDFTHDQPNPMSDAHMQGESSEKGKALPAYDSSSTWQSLERDKEKLTRAIAKGNRG